jgi:starch synthase (maltosyl-transferring)
MVKLVCVSQAVAEKCVQEEGISPSRVSVIPNGISLEQLSSLASVTDLAELDEIATRGIPTDAPLLVFVGRLSAQKGILTLVQKVDRLLEKLPEHHFLIVGDGPERSSVETAVAQSKTANRVHLLGWRANAIYWINRSQLLLLPSLYEGMPNVVLEAMGCGKPVVTFAVEGIDDLLPNEPLQVVQGREIDRFVAQVNHLASDAELCGRLGARNRQRIEQHFRLEDQVAKYEQLYLQHVKATQGFER